MCRCSLCAPVEADLYRFFSVMCNLGCWPLGSISMSASQTARPVGRSSCAIAAVGRHIVPLASSVGMPWPTLLLAAAQRRALSSISSIGISAQEDDRLKKISKDQHETSLGRHDVRQNQLAEERIVRFAMTGRSVVSAT